MRVLGLGVLLTFCLFVSCPLVIFTPVPLFVASTVLGRKGLILVAFLSGLVVAGCYLVFPSWLFLPGADLLHAFPRTAVQIFGMTTFVCHVLIATLFLVCLRRQWTPGVCLGTTLAAVMGVIVTVIATVAVTGHIALRDGFRAYLGFVLDAMPTLPPFDFLLTHRDEVITMAIHLLPAVIFLSVLLTIVASGIMSRRIVKYHSGQFRLPDVWVWLPIISGMTFFVDLYVVHSTLLKTIALNGIIIGGALAFVQGLAVVLFFLERVRTVWFRLTMIVVMVMFFHTTTILLAGIGLADVWIRFRRQKEVACK